MIGDDLSYDLQVFARQLLDHGDLVEVVAESGLAADPDVLSAAGLGPVTRGVRATYCFTLALPVRVEPEDVPEEVTPLLMGATCLYAVSVEGSSAANIPHAHRFARRLARRADGAVLDPQTDKVWAAGKLRTAPKIERGLTDVIALHWYFRPVADVAAAPRSWLATAARHLPEALPRRFGPYEPLGFKLDEDGPDAFVRAVVAEDLGLYFACSRPCIEGSARATEDTMSSFGLTVHRSPFNDPTWRDALQRLFIGFAQGVGAIFASAEIERNIHWSGRGLGYGPEAETGVFLAPRGEWSGLLPYPPWWAWFGTEYAPLVANHLEAESTTALAGGIFHARAQDPTDRDTLERAVGGTRLSTLGRRGRTRLRRISAATSWLPDDLMVRVTETDPRVRAPSREPAPTIPDLLP